MPGDEPDVCTAVRVPCLQAVHASLGIRALCPLKLRAFWRLRQGQGGHLSPFALRFDDGRHEIRYYTSRCF